MGRNCLNAIPCPKCDKKALSVKRLNDPFGTREKYCVVCSNCGYVSAGTHDDETTAVAEFAMYEYKNAFRKYKKSLSNLNLLDVAN